MNGGMDPFSGPYILLRQNSFDVLFHSLIQYYMFGVRGLTDRHYAEFALRGFYRYGLIILRQKSFQC